ncbi:MAG: cytochrome c biogenesis protein CcdA [Bacteroidota bacterium]|nr:cytochrome c biogenesis protein CcdA [Bacteroidota bacterium]
MNRSILKRLLVALMALLPILSAAQILEPIKWKFELKNGSGTEKELFFIANIDKGWHLYTMNLPEGGPVSTSFEFEKLEGATLVGKTQARSKAISKMDEQFGMTLSWFVNQAVFVQKIKLTNPSGFLVRGHVTFLGCNDESCLPPSPAPFEFKGGKPIALVSRTAKDANQPATGKPTATVATQQLPIAAIQSAKHTGTELASDTTMAATRTTIDSVLWTPVIDELKAYGSNQSGQNTSWWILFITGFLGGLLALLTPCVWPVIPMTVSFFLKRNTNRGKAVREAMLYGLSIVIIYLLLGLGITLIFGASALNSLSTSAIFNLIFFALLVLFAVSFFGAFEIVLPSSWTNKMDRKADSTSGLISLFFMAFTLVLVSFSCTGPIIGTLLVQAASMNSIAGPATGMFGFALALAIPFALFAIFPNWLKSMPKSGSWLNTVKVVLGFLELAFSLKFLSVADLSYGWGILNRETFLSLWIVIFALMGFYLLGKIRLPNDDVQAHVSVPRLFLALFSLAFAIYMVPGLWGAPVKAVSAFAPPAYTQDFNLNPNEVNANFTDYEAGMTVARLQNKPVLIDFSGFGCVNCRKMEQAVWQDPQVKKLIEDKYVLISLMVDDKTPLTKSYQIEEYGKTRTIRTIGDHWSFLQRHKFGANAQPFYVLLSPEGKPLGPSYSYNENVQAYVRFLENGLRQFAQK